MELLTKAQARTFAKIMGVVCLALALITLLQGADRPSGRWAWLIGPFFDVAGSVGVAVFFVLIGAFLFLVSFRKD